MTESSLPSKADQTQLSEFRRRLTPEEHLLVEGWERAHGRTMTDQEIRLGLEQLRAIGELK